MSFINLNLDELLNGGTFSVGTLEGVGPVSQKRVSLDPPQMSMFTDVDVTKLPDGTVWLDFLSLKYAPNKEVMDFMAYCYDRWGADKRGRGLPCDADVPALKSGKFGRTWENVRLIQIKRPEHLSLTIALRIIIDNEDMSNFINQLAKGFVRSAVNQVGRDGGRVVSNQIYHGQNYIPIADVSQPTPPPAGNNPQQNIPSSAYSTTKPLSAGKIILFVALSLFLFPIGTIGVFIYGIVKLCDYSDKIEWLETSPQYVQDRRYKSGVRYVGDSTTKKSMNVTATPNVRAIHKRNGIIAIAIALFFGLAIGISLILK